MGRTILDDLSWREKLFMMIIVGSWFAAISLIAIDVLYKYMRPSKLPCGVECKQELKEIQDKYIQYREAGHSCAVEFYLCLDYMD